jgi:hypothetical protein
MISKEMKMLWSQIRRAWTSFSPNRRAVLDEGVIKVPKIKQDGTESKVLVNHWRCSVCGELVTERDVDHVEAVGAQPRTDEEVAAACARLFCGRDNLRIICRPCHVVKSAKEKSSGTYKRGRQSAKT